jgi:hypothetical protein
MRYAIFWDVTSCGAFKNRRSYKQLIVTAYIPSSRILFTLMMQALRSSETPVLAKATRRTSQNTAFIVDL